MASEATVLLQRLGDGDRSALGELMPVIYSELPPLAQASLPPGPRRTLPPSAMVHEAYLKLFGEAAPRLSSRAHLLAMTAKVMRRVLIDRARAKSAAKRGGDAKRVTLVLDIQIARGAGGEVRLLEL